jgi:hypothetical protein
MIPPSTPIDETLHALKLAFDVPSHVRTAGDLVVALERKELPDVPPATAKKIKESIA